jgi:chromatin segregation and condensation protein Rec8/ScpA/Scc1 (kleisin family)
LDAALAHRAVPLSLSTPAEWLIMAAWLLVLRSRLLLPAEAAESAAARDETASPLQQRAAIASTQMAGLELSREGTVALEQRHAFSEVRFSRAAAPSTDAQAMG